MELVTGHAGTNHISSADMASMYRGLLTSDNVVLASANKLACTVLDANTVQIDTGDCMLQAHHARVEVAEQVTIESGSVGYKRNDLIVARYTLGDGNVQQVYLDVIKGTPVAGTASDPTYTTGSIDGGDILVEFPLWRIPIDGVNVGTPVRIMPTIDTLQTQITANKADITSLRESVTQIVQPNPTGSTGQARLVKNNRTVRMVATFKAATTVGTDVSLFSIPSGFRPSYNVDVLCILWDSSNTIWTSTCVAATDGSIKQIGSGAVTRMFAVAEWLI